jgi:sensor c-di-GMP phosphodiesterase-like protein
VFNVAGRGVGLPLRSPRHRKWKVVAIVFGILAASVPVLMLNAWLRNQGEDEASVTAAWALGYAEAQVARAAAAIKELAARGIDGCKPPHVEAMRRAALQSGVIKELVLIGPNGQTACADSGPPSKPHVIVSVSTADRELMLDLVRISEERFLRVRRLGKTDKPALAALVPASLLLPQVSILGGPLNGSLRLTLAGGAQLSEAGESVENAPEQYHARQRSQAYGLSLGVSLPRNGMVANQDGLRRIGMVVTGLIAIAILMFALVLIRRRSGSTVADLTRAIMAEEFVPYYQPVVDIQTGRLLGAEVLARWRKRDGSFLEPAAFVALMETSGLAVELTRSLMRRVRDEIGPALGKRHHVSIAFNVAPQHFEDAEIIGDIGTIFDGSALKLSQIVLELTERSRIENLAGMRKTIAALQGMGCKVAIDDMGNGHSGLSYVLKLGVDIIKIDKIFVQAIDTESHSRTIIETLIDLAKSMRMDIVAEGVENFDQVTYLRERGITAAQGYVFAPPLPSTSFLQLLDAMDPVTGAAEAPAPAKPAVQPKVALPRPVTTATSARPAQASPARPARAAAG